MSDRQDLETTAIAVVSLERLAGEAYNWFETAYRGDDPEQPYTRLRDGAPEWLSDLVREAHGEMFPDDWRYDAIRSACGAIHDDGANYDDPNEQLHDWVDSYVDIYTMARLAWLASNLRRVGYCDDAHDEFGPADSIVDAIGRGQYMEACEVFASVLSSLEAQVAA